MALKEKLDWMALEESLDWIATESDLDEVEDQIQNVKFIVDHRDNQDAFYSVDELNEAIVQRNSENRNRLTEWLGPVFLEFLISDSLQDPFVQGQVCKTLNLMLRSTPQILRNNFFSSTFRSS